jgi:hypothetical protein
LPGLFKVFILKIEAYFFLAAFFLGAAFLAAFLAVAMFLKFNWLVNNT